MSARLVLYYAPWCGHCRVFKKKDWKEFKIGVQNNKYVELSNLQIDEINCQENPDKGKNIRSFPTVILYVHGQEIIYDGNRQSDDLYIFVKKYI